MTSKLPPFDYQQHDVYLSEGFLGDEPAIEFLKHYLEFRTLIRRCKIYSLLASIALIGICLFLLEREMWWHLAVAVPAAILHVLFGLLCVYAWPFFEAVRRNTELAAIVYDTLGRYEYYDAHCKFHSYDPADTYKRLIVHSNTLRNTQYGLADDQHTPLETDHAVAREAVRRALNSLRFVAGKKRDEYLASARERDAREPEKWLADAFRFWTRGPRHMRI